MSSVGSSDSSDSSSQRAQAAEIRRNREAHQSAEADMVKKQAKEIRRLNEEHYAEVENLKREHQAQMDDLRKATNNDITARDHKYNQDVEELRDLYKRQMTQQADESQKKQDALRKATSGDLDQSKAQTDARLARLTSDYEKGLQEREHGYEESLKQNRDDQKNAIADNRDKLQRNHDMAMKSVKDERNKRVGDLQKSFDDYRQITGAEKRDTELRHLQDQQRASNNLLRAVQKERAAKQDSEEYLRDGFKDAIEKTHERFEKAAAREREANNLSRDQMKSTVGDRIDSQVHRLESENYDLREGNARSDLKNRQQMRREISNISDSYQRSMEAMQDERNEAVRQSNDRVHRGVQKVRKEMEHQATETNRYYRQQQAQNDTIHREAYDNLKVDLENRAEQTKVNADLRVKNLYEQASDEKARLAELQVENHKANQNSHQDEMNTLRANLEADKQIAVTTLTDRLQKQEVMHSERMAQVVGKYEKQIQTLKDELTREKKQNDENLKRATEEMQRQHKLAMDQSAQQNRERLRQVDAHHNEELRSLNKRNDERLDQVVSQIKKT